MLETVVVLVSGGSDSAVLTALLLTRHRRVVPAFVREGLAWEGAELEHLRRLLAAIANPSLAALELLDLPLVSSFGPHWSVSGQGVPAASDPDTAVYLPGRNLLLLARAALLCYQCDADYLALGVLRGNPFSDATPAFFSAMQEAISLALARPIEVLVPFSQLSKAEVLLLGRELPLELTFSCLAPQGLCPCGRCQKCQERQEAFADARIPDPTDYAQSPPR